MKLQKNLFAKGRTLVIGKQNRMPVVAVPGNCCFLYLLLFLWCSSRFAFYFFSKKKSWAWRELK